MIRKRDIFFLSRFIFIIITSLFLKLRIGKDDKNKRFLNPISLFYAFYIFQFFFLYKLILLTASGHVA